MKKLDRYILGEMVVPFLIGTVAVVLMFQANTYIALAKNLNIQNVPLKAVFQFIYFQTPGYMSMTLPVGTSLAASLAISRLARESELTAMRAAGTRILRIIWPIMLFGVGVAFANCYLVEHVVPPATKQWNRLGWQIGVMGYAPEAKTNTVLTLGKFTASFGTVTKTGEDSLQIEKILLVEQPDLETTMLTTAKTATYSGGKWTLQGAYLRVLKGQDLLSAEAVNADFNEKIIVADLFNPPMGEELTIPQLKESIAAGKRTGANVKQLEVKLHVKYSLPAACIVFALVAPVYAIYFARGGGFIGVFLSIIMVLVYYNAYVISTEIISKYDPVPAWVAAWLPNILFGLMGLVAVRRLE